MKPWGPGWSPRRREKTMLVCEYCMEALRSRGEKFDRTDDILMSEEEARELSGTEEVDGNECTCEWCGEYADLFGIWFRKEV